MIHLGKSRFPTLPSLLLACLVGCGDSSSASVTLDDLPRFVLTEELRMGSADDPAVGFTRIGGIEVDDDGLVYVLEAEDRHIRVYDAAGTRARTIGGPGEGPGEFTFRGVNTRFGIIADTLWVSDTNAGRFSLFTLDGQVLETVQTAQAIAEVIPGVPLGLRPTEYVGGGLFVSTYSIPGGAMSTIANSARPVRAPVVLMDRGGGVRDTLRYETLRASSPVGVEVAGQRATVPQAPDDGPLYVDGRGTSYGVERAVPQAGAPAVITVFRVAGADTAYRRTIGYQPKPWSAERVSGMMAASLRLWSNRVGEGADTAAAAAAVREAMTLPPSQPPISAVRVGDDDVVWLSREDDPASPPEWVMIGPDGEPIGAVTGEPKTTLHWSSGDTVWGVALDGLDVPWLVRYRLTPGS
jgi:hypothetical protein